MLALSPPSWPLSFFSYSELLTHFFLVIFFFILPLLGQFLSCLLTRAPFWTFSLLLCLIFSPIPSPHSLHAPIYYTSLASYTDSPSQPLPPQVLEKCKEEHLTKSIGMSNCNCRQLEMMLKKPALKHKPVCNQVRPGNPPPPLLPPLQLILSSFHQVTNDIPLCVVLLDINCFNRTEDVSS